MGAALACADLFGLTAAQSVDAMGNVGSTAGGLCAFLKEGTSTKQWHCGHAASDAVLCAQLAGAGLRGPRHLMENARGFHAVLCPGAQPDQLTIERGHRQIHDTSYKPWPPPRPTHAAITAALEAHATIEGARIERATLRTFGMAVDLCNHDPVATEHDARFSLRHCTAVARTRGAVDFDAFETPEIESQSALVRSIEVGEDPAMTMAYSDRSQASLEVVLADGRVLSRRVDHALGEA